MDDKTKTKAKLARLQAIDEKNRERSMKYLDKRKKDGMKQISAIISEKAYRHICQQRDTAKRAGKTLSAGEILEHALWLSLKGNPDTDINTSVNTDKVPTTKKPHPNTQVDLPMGQDEAAQTTVSVPSNLMEDIKPGSPEHERLIFDFIHARHKKGSGKKGKKSLEEIRVDLNDAGIKTIKGETWNNIQNVGNAYKALKEKFLPTTTK